MENNHKRSDAGFSLLEVMVAIAILGVILYQLVLFDFDGPKDKVDALYDVDHSHKEIASLLADARICRASFKDKKVPVDSQDATPIFNIAATRCKPCPHTNGTQDQRDFCKQCPDRVWCEKGSPCNIYIYESSQKFSDGVPEGVKPKNKVSITKKDGNRIVETVELDSMELRNRKDGTPTSLTGTSTLHGHLSLMLRYKTNRTNSSNNIIERRIPIFVTANRHNNIHKIQECGLSSSYCNAKTLVAKTFTCNTMKEFNLRVHKTGKKVRKEVKGNGCTCIGSFFCYSGYWSFAPPVCFKE